jgi:GxxExxY protein
MKQVIVPVEIERLARMTVDAALTVHRTLGPGLLESAYQQCLAIELVHQGLSIEQEKSLPLIYRDQPVETSYRLDLIVGGRLLVELKTVESVLPIHQAQVVTYLKLLRLPLGLLINFNVPLVKDGITRILNLDFQTEVTALPRARSESQSFLRS